MTMEMIQVRARELETKTRRELFANMGIALVVTAVSIRGMTWTHNLALRALFSVALAWALAGQYLIHRGMWLPALPGESALKPCLEFYRREIERRLNLFRRVLQWTFGPLVLSIGSLIVVMSGIARGRNLSSFQVLPFSVVFAVWIVLYFIRRSRGQKALQREMDELARMDRVP